MTHQTRCLCGTTIAKFEADKILWQGLCHCESCRRASGAPIVGWFGVANGAWAWAGAPPKQFQSSGGVTRYFCETCGSPMAFYSKRWPNEVHFPGASLENPEDFKPTFHCYTGEHISWLKVNDGLKRYTQTSAEGSPS